MTPPSALTVPAPATTWTARQARVQAAAEHAAPWFAALMAFGLPWARGAYRVGLVGLLACLVLAWPWKRLVETVRRDPVVQLALALLAWIAAGMLYSPAPRALAWHDVDRYIKLLLLLPLVLFVTDLRAWQRVLIAYAAGTAVLVLPTALDATGLLQHLPLDLSRLRDASYNPDESRVYFRNHIVHGVHVNLVLVMVMMGLVQLQRHRGWLLAALAVGVLDILFFLHARGALLALGVVGLGIAVTSLRAWRLRAAAIVGVALLAVGLYLASPHIRDRIDSSLDQTTDYFRAGDNTSSVGIRLQYWKTCLELASATPLAPVIGSGPGSFRDAVLHLEGPELLREFWHAHNEYLMLLGQHGIVGLGLFIALLLATGAATRHAPPLYRGIVRWGLVVFALSCLTDASLHNEWEGRAFMLWLGLAVAVRNTYRSPAPTAVPLSGLAVSQSS